MLNFKKVKDYILERIEKDYKNYYPHEITDNLSVEVNGGSFGACLISIKSDAQYSISFRYVANYSDIDEKISDFMIRNYELITEKCYREYKNQSSLEMLYNSKLKFNCSYYEMKRQNKSDLLIVCLGTNDFIITNNYHGVIAYGKRAFSFENNKALYLYELVNTNFYKSDIVALIKKYELKHMKNNNKYAVEIVESEK